MNINQVLATRSPKSIDDQGNTIYIAQSPYHPTAHVISFVDASGYHHGNIGNVQDGPRIEGYPDTTDFVVEYYKQRVRA